MGRLFCYFQRNVSMMAAIYPSHHLQGQQSHIKARTSVISARAVPFIECNHFFLRESPNTPGVLESNIRIKPVTVNTGDVSLTVTSYKHSFSLLVVMCVMLLVYYQ